MGKILRFIILGVCLAACAPEIDSTPNFGAVYQREQIKPDYSNVRGLNYLATYPDLLVTPPPALFPGQNYVGVANTQAMWLFYQPDDVFKQLGYMRGIGVNSIRVFLSHPAWLFFENERIAKGGTTNQMVENYKHLLRSCEFFGIYLMPVFWDAISLAGTQNPGPEPWKNLRQWLPNPGNSNTTLAWLAANPDAEDYVISIVNASRDSENILAYDVMNEPQPIAAGEFMRHFARLIRSLDTNPDHRVTIGYAAQLNFGPPNPLEGEAAMDLLSFHPYGNFYRNLREWERMARIVGTFWPSPLPILATEAGGPSMAQPYEEILPALRNLGIGFMSWNAMIGGGKFPLRTGSGIFYHNGKVRHAPAARAWQLLALQDGVDPRTLEPIVELPRSSQYFVQEEPYANGYGTRALVADLEPSQWANRPMLTTANFKTVGYDYQAAQLASAATSYSYMYDLGGVVRGLLTPQEQATLATLQQEFGQRNLYNPNASHWLTPGGQIDWQAYHDFFTRWGNELWKVIDKYKDSI